MTAPLYDAHAHLADPRLEPYRGAIEQSLKEINCQQTVVNGTSPADWHAVVEYTKSSGKSLPAIGLHPWQVKDAPADWKAQFSQLLNTGAVTVIGEIGLDQWIEGHDIEQQQAAFKWQLEVATQRNLPVSIHCLRAMQPLLETLLTAQLPQRGIHLHAFNGSAEDARRLVELGAYFSFNAGQLKPNAKTVFEAIRAIPEDRLLIETDAPDMLPPSEYREFELPPAKSSTRLLNHPANLHAAYKAIADIRSTSFNQLAIQVEQNFQRYFIQTLREHI
ncbi:MAG: TatD family hydrolase [Opitutales bacterium]|jgi:TatD DNase family protein|nr:TatD family hydrolase [Opitutales bacterium]MDP4777094.1 TatD family hydrolase [Opitutales bacterium]MDP4884754.1 TatD family hydrolase [Opitutales bacterium]MDP5079345.1 TatD family hydrolase [Opitutales bacterium]